MSMFPGKGTVNVHWEMQDFTRKMTILATMINTEILYPSKETKYMTNRSAM